MKVTGWYPRAIVDTARVPAVGQAGGVLLTETVRISGLTASLSAALAPWAKDGAIHDPGKILTDLAITLALGGDTLSDLGVLRGEPVVYGVVASDPTVSRLMAVLGADADRAEAAIGKARAAARAAAWAAAGSHAPDAAGTAANPITVDLDATLITAHSEKEAARPTFKRGFGFHPLCAFADHGPAGSGEALVIKLRPGNAGSNTAKDHIEVVKQALTQLPGVNPSRPGKKVLIRTDGGGGTHEFIDWLTRRGVQYSIGFTLPTWGDELYRKIPEKVWAPAYDTDRNARDGADVAEFTGIMDLKTWPKGMRVIVRRERPHPGAALRFEDVDGYRLTAFVTNTITGQLPDLELRHRRRARCEDRIRNGKDLGLRNLPLRGFGQNRIWCQIVALASELTAWMGLLAHPTHEARRWEPKRLRFRLYSIAAVIARSGRRLLLHLSDRARWTGIAIAAITRLRALPTAPG
ncbi:MAG: IS1380 family transposase [Leifsonia sp.]